MGIRGRADRVISATALTLGTVSAAAVLLGFAVLTIWSFAGFWGFPDALPDSFTIKNWMRHGDGAWEAFGETALLAIIVTLIAITLTIGCLEAEFRHGLQLSQRGMWLLYLRRLRSCRGFRRSCWVLGRISGASRS